MRINPECSTQVGHAIYDPCVPGSRFGVTKKKDFRPDLLEGVSGLHFHTLCQQNAEAINENCVYFDEVGIEWIEK